MWWPEGSPACWLVTSTWSPPKSLAWQKEFRLGSGLIWRVLRHWLLACNRPLLVSGNGVLLVVVVGVLWLVALLLWLLFSPAGFRLIGGLLLILQFGLFSTVVGGVAVLLSLCSVLTFGLPLGCMLLIKVGVPSRLRFNGSGVFTMSVSSLCLDKIHRCS